MKNLSFYVIIDNLFKFVLLFLINLIWCTYFFNSPLINVVISVVLSLSTVLIVNKISKRKKHSKIISLKEEQHINDITNTFIFMTKQEIVSFFYKLSSSRHKCTQRANYVEIETATKPIFLFPAFKPTPLTCDDVLEIYKKIKAFNTKKLIILTNDIAPNTWNITKHINFEVLILNKKECYYNLLKEYEFYPEIKIKNNDKKIKNNIKELLSLSLNKKKTRGYLFSAIFLLFSSFFVKFKIYYLIFSSALIFLALFSYLSPTFNNVEKNKIFE